jgi:glycosyltransferase involved in cell wall biosynthesis
MENELISILIPVYNRDSLIIETVQSALDQTYENFEVIICDNKSTDNTWSVIQDLATADNRIRVYQNEENIGPVNNWRRCVDYANGRVCKILFSDDLISENYLSECHKALNKDVAFVLSDVQLLKDNLIVKDDYIFSKYKKFNQSEFFESILLYNHYGFPISPGAAFFRKSDLLAAIKSNIENPFNLDFSKYGAGNDLLIFLLIANQYDNIAVAPRAKSFFRIHNESFTISNDLNLYYQYIKHQFIVNYKEDLNRKFTAYIKLENFRNGSSALLLPLLNSRMDYFYLCQIIFNKTLDKIKVAINTVV